MGFFLKGTRLNDILVAVVAVAVADVCDKYKKKFTCLLFLSVNKQK